MNILKRLRKPYISIILTSLFLFVSCNGSELNSSEQSIIENFKTRIIKDSNLSSNLNNLFNTKFSNKNTNTTFNFDKITEVEDINTGDICYMIDSNDKETVKLGAYPKGENEFNLLIVEYLTNGDNKNILYKKTNGNLMLKVSVNTKTEQITFSSFKSKNLLRGCGEDVADCVSDAYSNHGWKSVASWVITGFYPAFGVGIALGCTARECVD